MSKMLTKVTFNDEGIFKATSARLIDMKPWNDFASKAQIGYTYILLLENNSFEKVEVKVEGLIPAITSENLAEAKEPIYMTFENFVGKFYFSDRSKSFELTCKASKALIVRQSPKA
jgi:hypothetical protein